ncbi:dihydroxyacetone kinase subunit DhaL [Allokutzneria sp. A3M-2-11 16]|uniref:dihydroxyacetone kinase subunit DhaL n=1 Tax=Allokutzneria sp. A3M-2-11 16 TaxID=2962043 RepID=UPI0020B8B935|nr:dihydroxyacetone kinase subunit DhaL [Allokutzneria sp. A3M-2-11 16]MCP3798214.1 dihydroxyacetone kinase subunit DhaL [Allokutzneria sp. A3M-2-11 16]
MGCSVEDVTAAVRAAAEVVREYRDELVELDREIGDGDHGENLHRGFTAVLAKLDGGGFDGPASVLKVTATTLISTVGGAAGPLYGTAFLRAATALGDASEVDGQLAANALAAALEGVVARGKAAPGDKTMVDALTPAVTAAQSTVDSGVRAVLLAAADAAEEGAASTVPLVARKGRASYLGERSAGHLDPGARSTAVLLRALAEAARR